MLAYDVAGFQLRGSVQVSAEVVYGTTHQARREAELFERPTLSNKNHKHGNRVRLSRGVGVSLWHTGTQLC